MHTLKDKEFAALGAALSRIPSPCYVLQESKLLENLALIDRVRKEAGVEIIVALKASAMWSIFPIMPTFTALCMPWPWLCCGYIFACVSSSTALP